MAISWSAEIPRDPRGNAFPLRRTPAGGKLVACVTSENLTGCDTHFFGGHTVPCERPECDACGKGVSFRWHGYLAAIEASTRLHFIFEVTAQAADAFDQYRAAYGTLRGCRFEAERLHHRQNGRVIITTRPLDQQGVHLPQPPCIPDCMAIIWGLPANQIQQEVHKNGRGALRNTAIPPQTIEIPRRIIEPHERITPRPA